MRKLARFMAKARFKKSGYKRICKANNSCLSPAQKKRNAKHDYGRSYFSDNWRKAVGWEG